MQYVFQDNSFFYCDSIRQSEQLPLLLSFMNEILAVLPYIDTKCSVTTPCLFNPHTMFI